MKRIIVGISGASGTITAIRLLETLLPMKDVEVHLIISDAAQIVMKAELNNTYEDVAKLSDFLYDFSDLAAPIASGSFAHDGMIISPCSIKTLGAIAYSNIDNLLTRAADVCLKEGSPLLLALRETPLHTGHIRTMLRASENGAIIFPLTPQFYAQCETIEEMVDCMVGRMLQRIGIENKLVKVWQGISNEKK
jgi:4-hydroxy-3-polyprenylbenzoate decarboxylase